MQVSFSQWFQGIFENFQAVFDVIFAFFTMFGQELLFIVFMGICYWAIDKKIPIVVGVSALIASTSNSILKDICKIERPINDPNVRFVSMENFFVNTEELRGTYSFPSGHAMWASSLFCSLGLQIKNKKFWFFAIFMIVMVALSRIYLGVHWLLDVIVGSLLGFIIAYLVYLLFAKVKEKKIFIFIGLAIFGLIFIFFASSKDDFSGIGTILGLSLGVVFEEKIVNFDPKEGTKLKKIFRVIIGFILIFALKEGIKYLFNLINPELLFLHTIRYFILSFFAVAIYPLIFKKIKL